jgi:hypothetical protein
MASTATIREKSVAPECSSFVFRVGSRLWQSGGCWPRLSVLRLLTFTRAILNVFLRKLQLACPARAPGLLWSRRNHLLVSRERTIFSNVSSFRCWQDAKRHAWSPSWLAERKHRSTSRPPSPCLASCAAVVAVQPPSLIASTPHLFDLRANQLCRIPTTKTQQISS